jgi:hypothetical protein
MKKLNYHEALMRYRPTAATINQLTPQESAHLVTAYIGNDSAEMWEALISSPAAEAALKGMLQELASGTACKSMFAVIGRSIVDEVLTGILEKIAEDYANHNPDPYGEMAYNNAVDRAYCAQFH